MRNKIILIVFLCFFLNLISNALCPRDFKIEGEFNVCPGNEYTYNINYDKVHRGMMWEVTGGYITAIDGKALYDEFGNPARDVVRFATFNAAWDQGGQTQEDITLLNGLSSPGGNGGYSLSNAPIKFQTFGLAAWFLDAIGPDHKTFSVTVRWTDPN